MRKRIVFVDLDRSVVFNGKLKGFIELLRRTFDIIEIFHNELDSLPLNDSSGKTIIFLEPRQKLDNLFFEKIDLDKADLLFSCNHFMVTSSAVKRYIGLNFERVIFQVENIASVPVIKEFFNISDCDLIKVLLVPPVLDAAKINMELKSVRGARKVNSEIILAGAIYIHQWYDYKMQGSWWQTRFSVNDYYPHRKILFDYYKRFNGCNNYSRIVFRDDGLYRYINKFCAVFKHDLWARKREAYYRLNLLDGFANASFFWGVSDIFGVFPQICFQAMKAGCIIIGTNSVTFESLGFIDGFNYISIGSDVTIENIDKCIDRVKGFSNDEIRMLASQSSRLLNRIELDCINRIEALFDNSYIEL